MKEKEINQNWYGLEDKISEREMNIIDNENKAPTSESVGMITFDQILHEFQMNNRRCEVGVVDGKFGIRMWENKLWMKDEMMTGHTEQYAEDAADNYVFGIKN